MSDDVIAEDGPLTIFRPSYSATWLNCSGSLRPSMLAEDSAGEDAAVGTVFHAVLAEWQLNGRPDHWANEVWQIERVDKYGEVTVVYDVTIDEDMFLYGQECLDYVKNIPGKRYVETSVDISSITPIPNQRGTCDLACCDWGVLDITDWKYGRGVQVFAFKNTQLLLYAMGFFDEFDWLYNFQIIRMRIAQPRFRHWDVWEITREELYEFADWAKGRALRAWKRKADRSPSPKACQWCKVRQDCGALEVARQAIADLTFDVIEEPMTEKVIESAGRQLLLRPVEQTLPSPAQLDTSQLVRVYKWRKLMESWFADVGKALVERGLNGESLDGVYKVVEGRARRKYRDEDKAAEAYHRVGLSDDDIYESKLLSPNQLKTKLRALGIRGRAQDEFVRTLVYQPRGQPTLVPDGDARSELPQPADVFDVEDDREEPI